MIKSKFFITRDKKFTFYPCCYHYQASSLILGLEEGIKDVDSLKIGNKLISDLTAFINDHNLPSHSYPPSPYSKEPFQDTKSIDNTRFFILYDCMLTFRALY